MYRTCFLLACSLLVGCDGGLQTADELGQLPYGTGGSCAANAKPSIQLAPDEDGLSDAADPLRVTVSDADQAADTLVVSWSSDVDGAQGTLAPAADGTLALPTEALTPGDHGITVQVTDACEATALASVASCLQGELHHPELDFSALRLSGDASYDAGSGWLDVTPAAAAQVGSAFDDRRAVPAGEVSLSLRFTTGGDVGGDGMSITALDADALEGWHGGGGCGLGYGTAYDCTNGLALPGWSLELDFFANDHDPVDGPHVAFTLDGQMDAPLAWGPIPDVRGLAWHTLDLELSASLLTVRLDGQEVLSAPVDSGETDFPAYVGFTAGTGNSYQVHRIAEAELTTLACMPQTP